MQTLITEEADKLCPIKSFRIKNTKPSWVTNEVIEQMKDRDYFHQKAKRTNSEDDWNIAKFYRNQVNSKVRSARAEFIKDQLRNNEGNSAKFWRTIKQVMPPTKGAKSSAKIVLSDDHGTEIEGTHTADYLNNFFANIGNSDKPIMDITEVDLETSTNPHPDPDQPNKPFILEPISNLETRALVTKINISKSSGITALSSRLLKDSLLALSDKLTFLFNFSINETNFPDQWKKALVIPIPKPGDSQKANNYRPISLLPQPGKILEKLIHTQLSTYLEENELLSQNQFGFRKQ